MTHPLTDDIIESELATPTHFARWPSPHVPSGSLVGLFTHDDMRTAADWQLEADAEWWRIILNKAGYPPHDIDRVVEEFKQAMRPQEGS